MPLFDATPISRIHASWRSYELNALNPSVLQQRILERLIGRAEGTKFGRDHDFASISGPKAFQESVPLRHYEQFWREYWQPVFPLLVDCTIAGRIPYFALSSGTTTGNTKYIPCTYEMVFACLRASHDALVHHLLNRPHSRVFAGKCLLLGGSTDLEELAPGVRCGDLSAIEAWEVPWWERPWVVPSRDVALTPDWEEKIAKIAAMALHEDIRSISGAPNWLLHFFDRLFALKPNSEGLASVFPNLELVVHGGIDFAPYRERFRQLLQGTGAETREVYAASEGFIAVADRGDGEGLRLILDAGIFYEFVPVPELESARPTRHWIANIETGVEYAIVVSTCAGLWAYILGDTVRFVDRDPPRLIITGRTSYVLSAAGEHLIAEEIEEAVASAATAINAAVTDYSVGCLFSEQDAAACRHLYLVEFSDGVPDADRLEMFGHHLDVRLCGLNADYATRRVKDFGLRPPVVEAVGRGLFARWMKKRGKLGGQHKVPRVINDQDLFKDLRNFVSLP